MPKYSKYSYVDTSIRGEYPCEFCNYETDKKHLLILHYKATHKLENYNLKEEKTRFVCGICRKPRCNHSR